MDEIIKLNQVTYFYRAYDDGGKIVEIPAVSDITMSVYEGEFLALVGHNGSGKSTLAKLFNGLLIPRSGAVTVFGTDTKNSSRALFGIRKNVGMVFQNPDNQMVASIVDEDVAFGPENLGLPQEEIVARVSGALAAVGMQEFAKRSPHRLSGGQKQRIAIAGSLAIAPRVLVMDESTAMLDPEGRKEVLAVAKKLNKEQKMTIVLITHFMDEVLDADRVIVMTNGKIDMEGTPKEIFMQRGRLESAGLLAPRQTELAMRLSEAGVKIGEYITDTQALGEELCRLL